MSRSAFAQLLEEGQTLLHQRNRRAVMLHFTWDGTDRAYSWCAWHDALGGAIYKGNSGEQALRRLVEALHGD
jgi:hypothetical protein